MLSCRFKIKGKALKKNLLVLKSSCNSADLLKTWGWIEGECTLVQVYCCDVIEYSWTRDPRLRHFIDPGRQCQRVK